MWKNTLYVNVRQKISDLTSTKYTTKLLITNKWLRYENVNITFRNLTITL